MYRSRHCVPLGTMGTPTILPGHWLLPWVAPQLCVVLGSTTDGNTTVGVWSSDNTDPCVRPRPHRERVVPYVRGDRRDFSRSPHSESSEAESPSPRRVYTPVHTCPIPLVTPRYSPRGKGSIPTRRPDLAYDETCLFAMTLYSRDLADPRQVDKARNLFPELPWPEVGGLDPTLPGWGPERHSVWVSGPVQRTDGARSWRSKSIFSRLGPIAERS